MIAQHANSGWRPATAALVALVVGALAAVGCAEGLGGLAGKDQGLRPDGAVDAAAAGDGASPGDFGRPPADLASSCLVPLQGELCPPLIYVSTLGDDFRNGDKPDQAVRTLPVAIAKALRCVGPPCPIVVAGGTYSAQVVLGDGVTLLGGFTQDFAQREPMQNEVIITSDDPRTLVAERLLQPTIVDGVTLQGATLASADGRSSAALWAHETRQALKLRQVTIRAGKGAAGAPGMAGAELPCGTTAASGGTAFDCGGSSGAFGTAAGDPVVEGGGGTGGNSNCPSACPLVGTDGISGGMPGRPGGAGANGPAGVAAVDVFGGFTNGFWSAPLGMAGSRGRNGTGGGGGGSGGTKRIRACFGCGTLLGGRGGDGGVGGCGGGPGGAGGPGGGAFALVLWDADIRLDGATIQGGVGGNGGKGGDGQGGQEGGKNVMNGLQPANTAKCGLINYSSGGGGVGGVGGKGGAGGGGPGGTGGPAITVVRIGNSMLNLAGAVKMTPGTAGVGGAGGAGAGNPGPPGQGGAAAGERVY